MDEKKTPPAEKKKPGKGVIAAFCAMGAVIIGLIAALIITNLPPSLPVQGNAVIVSEQDGSAESGTASAPDSNSARQDGGSVNTPQSGAESTPQESGTENGGEPPAGSEVNSEDNGGTRDSSADSTGSQGTPADTISAPRDDTPADSTSKPPQTSAPQTSAKPVSSTAKPQEAEGYLLEYSIDNTWESGSETMYGVQLGITNNSGSTVSGWTLELTIGGISSAQGWNGTFTVSGDTLTVTNAEYNGDIFSGGTVVVGGNFGTGGAFKVSAARLNGSPCTVKEGNVDQNNQNNQNNQNGAQGGQSTAPSQNAEELLERSDKAVQGDDWLYTDGRRILDKDGKEVWLTGVNWFGYNTGTNTFDGLWNSELKASVEGIADHGFNLIRVPISAQLINQWAAGEYPKANYNNASNPELNGMNSLQIFDYFLKLAEENGLKVMPDIHSAETNASGHVVNLWYTSAVSAEDFYSALEWMADRYKNNDTIIAYDLKNEPHGKPYEGDGAAIWNDSTDPNNWKYAAETAAARILAKNPNVLILVEGTEIYPVDINTNGDFHSTNDKDYYFNWWGGNLRGVRDFPVDLGKHRNKLVYSPHDYGPTVYRQPWFEGDYDYDSLMADCWRDNWFYIYEEDIAPLLIGEWGGFMSEPNLTWMTHMRTLIKTYRLNHTFWCYNANSGDTGGLVLDDFKTWDEEKYAFVKEVLWQENGKFVGLDHAIPLGDNGITLSQANGL